MKRRAVKSLPLLAGTLMLAGCISFGAPPPPSLLTLDAQSQPTPGQVQQAGARTILIAVPATSQALATQRVPVQATDTSIAYVKDALWAEPPNRLFARLLTDTVTARTGRVVLGGATSSVDPAARLSGDLRQFGIDAATNSAVVTFDAMLLKGTGDTASVTKQRFEARVPIAAIDAANAGIGLNQAANQVATQVADWVGR